MIFLNILYVYIVYSVMPIDRLRSSHQTQVISPDALRMRLRRLCSVSKSGKSKVGEDVRKDYEQNGEKREWLEIALLEAVKKFGTSRSAYNQIKAIGNLGGFRLRRCISLIILQIVHHIYEDTYPQRKYKSDRI